MTALLLVAAVVVLVMGTMYEALRWLSFYRGLEAHTLRGITLLGYIVAIAIYGTVALAVYRLLTQQSN